MNRLMRRLARWGLGDAEGRVFLSELDELYVRKVETAGRVAADRWRRRELRRAVFHALATRLRPCPRPAGSAPRSFEATRRGGAGMVFQDLRHAARRLRRNPRFALVAVMTLGLGIGANTALFSVVSAVLLKPLPYPESERLVYIDTYWTPESGYDFPDYAVGSPEYFDYTNQNRSMEEVAAVSTEPATIVDGAGTPEVVRAGWVSPSMFSVLRTPPLLGRTLIEADGGPAPAQVVVLGYDLWQRRFGADSAVLGRRIALGMEEAGEPILAEIVGVMPPGFGYPDEEIELWGPLPLDPARTWRGGHWFDMIGRLAPGISFEQGQAEMAAMMSRWAVAYPDHHVGHGLQMRSLLDEKVGDTRQALLLLMGSVGLVLLIACANVAGLLLARAESRRREVAVRSALGASRPRLFRHALAESVLLALAGGALGLVLAWGGVAGLLRLEAGSLPRADEVGIDPIALLFTGAVIVFTTVLFGLTPALREARPGAADALRAASLKTAAAPSQLRFRKGLVVAEVALSVLLVVGAGLLIRSFERLVKEDPGIPTRDLLFAQLSLPAARYDSSNVAVFFDQLLEKTRALPDVRAATLLSRPPLLYSDQRERLHIEGRAPAASGPLCCLADPIVVGDGFFETVGVGVARGRVFRPEDHDDAALPVVVVDEAAAERWWPGEDPVHQRVRFGGEGTPWYTVVGVVGNVTFDAPGEFWPHVFISQNRTASHDGAYSTYLTVRTVGNPAAAGTGIRRVVRELDPQLAIARSFTMDEILDRAVARPRFLMTLLSVFAGVALFLGAIGIYGVVAYAVALRSWEIGLRRALGAPDGEVMVMVLGQGLRLAVTGLGLGLVGALVTARVLTGLLHDVSPTDPLTFALVAGCVALVALAAAYAPARRASRMDPLEALRAE